MVKNHEIKTQAPTKEQSDSLIGNALAEAQDQVEAMTGDWKTPVRLRLIDQRHDVPKEKRRGAVQMHGSLDDEAFCDRLWKLNSDGYDAYIIAQGVADPPTPEMVAIARKRGLEPGGVPADTAINKDHISEARVLMADADDLDPIEDFHRPPTAILRRENSERHFWLIWRVEGMPVNQIRTMLKRIIQRYGTDPAVCDPARIIRLAGFVSHKREEKTRYVVEGGLGEAVRFINHKDVLPEVKRELVKSGDGGDDYISETRLRFLLKHINPECGKPGKARKKWIATLGAIVDAKIGRDDQTYMEYFDKFELAGAWSSGELGGYKLPPTNYEGSEDVDNTMESLTRGGGEDCATIGTIVHMAKAAGMDEQEHRLFQKKEPFAIPVQATQDRKTKPGTAKSQELSERAKTKRRPRLVCNNGDYVDYDEWNPPDGDEGEVRTASTAKDFAEPKRKLENPPSNDDTEPSEATDGKSDPELSPLVVQSFAQVLAKEPQPVAEIIPGRVEKGVVNFLSGPGGSHKSRLVLQYCLCVQARKPVFGAMPERATAVYVSAEDGEDEVIRRAHKLAQRLDVPKDAVRDAAYVDRYNLDSALARMREGGDYTLTPFYDQLGDYVTGLPGHKFVVLDSAYDFVRFHGSAKINEDAVNVFIKVVLAGFCRDTNSTLLIPWHPSYAGQERGDGSGWSVAWHNAPRVRDAISKIKDADAYILEAVKRNHGALPEPLTLHYSDGALLPLGELEQSEQKAELAAACIEVATLCAERGIPITKQRRIGKTELDLLRERVEVEPRDAEMKDILNRAVIDSHLDYVIGTKYQRAGYYPASRSDELAKDAKRAVKSPRGGEARDRKPKAKTGAKTGAKTRQKPDAKTRQKPG